MPKYISGRSKVTPQSKLQSDRYSYLSIESAEPNLGDPLVGPSSIGAKSIPPGNQYIIVSTGTTTGERYWIPNQGGIIPGSISVFDEGTLVGTLSSITQLNFVGAAITASVSVASSNLATIRVFSPGNNKELLFNTANEFSTSTKLTFDTSNGLLTAGDRITVGAGGTVITTTGSGSVGIGTTNPTQELHVQGDLRLTGTIYDYNNQPGNTNEILVKNNLGGLTWIDQGAIISGAGGTYQNIQFHNNVGLVDGAPNFVYDEVNGRIGIGSTQPKVTLDVLGISSFKGDTTIDNLNVTGVTTTSTLAVSGTSTTRNLVVSGVTTIGFVTGTSAFFTGIVTASKFVGEVDVSQLYVTGVSTFLQKVNINNDLGVTGLTTTQNLQVYQSTTLNRLNVTGVSTFNSQVNINNLNVTGVGTFDDIKLDTNTISTIVGNLILDSIAGTTQINDSVYVNDTTESTSKDTGSFFTEGGVGIEKRLNVGGQVNLATSGGITTTGGDLYVGGNLYLSQDIFQDEIFARNGFFTGITSTKDLLVTGIATIATLGVSGLTTTRDLRVIGISTFDGLLDANAGATIDNIQIGISGDNEIDTSSGNLTIDSFSGTTTIDDQLIVSGISTFNGNVTLGDANTDRVNFISRVGTGITPSATDTHDLGSSTLRWNNIYAKTFDGVTRVTTTDLQTGNLLVTGIATVNGFFRPSVGSGADKGIYWATDPGGGSGDEAFIRYYVESGENTRLHIGIKNDADDDIYLESSQVTTSGNLTVSDNHTVTNDISLGKELNFISPIEDKYIDFYTKSSGGTNYSATLRLVNHDNTSYHNAIRMTRDGAVTLYYNGSDKLSTTNTGISVNGSITGQVIGNADTATQVSTGTTTGSSSYYLTFVDSNNSTRANEFLYTDAGISYNASTDSLIVSGDLIAQGGAFAFTSDNALELSRLNGAYIDFKYTNEDFNVRIDNFENNTVQISSLTGTGDLKVQRNIYASKFIGAVTGNADTATQVSTGTTTGSSSYYLTFVDSNNSTRANEFLYTDAGISYDPSTNTLSAAQFVGQSDNAFYSTGTNATDDVWGGSIEIREINQVTNTIAGNPSAYAPGLTFHWGSVAASAIKMYSDGSIRFIAQYSTGSSYRPIYASDGTFTGNLTVTGTMTYNGTSLYNQTVRFTQDIGLDAGRSMFFGREESFGGTNIGGDDYGYIVWDNDNNTYAITNTSGENGCLRIGTQNDGEDLNSDNLALEPAASLYLNPGGDLYKGNASNKQSIWYGSGTTGNISDNSVTLSESLRSNVNISGGGNITVNASGYIKWGTRFIVISNGRGSNFSTDGYFEISCPLSGTITGVGGASNVTATSDGIPLSSWQALYYILPLGSSNGSLAANFRVVSYTSNLDIPYNWVLICVANGDDGKYYFPTRGTLTAGTSAAPGVVGGITVQDEGTTQGTSGAINTINFVGQDITATASGNTATITLTTTAAAQAGATAGAQAAEPYAQQAASSATSAGQSATSAGQSATAANSSAQQAASSATSAGQSATAANSSAQQAASSATSAGQSATAAGQSAQQAASSATSAGQSATAAGQSAQQAAGSATSAGQSATAANSSAQQAASSAQQAASSASNAQTISDNIANGTTPASNANNIRTISDSTNAENFITFVNSNNGSNAYEALYTDAELKYNPSTNQFNPGHFVVLPTNVGSAANSTPTALCYGRLQAWGDLHINADTDNSGNEYIHLTSGYGTADSNSSNGLTIGKNTITWKGNSLAVTTGNVEYANNAGIATDARQVTRTVTGSNVADVISANIADNDFFRVRVGGTASNSGFAEIATADDGSEPIYVRQYNGVFSTVSRELTLLDSSGNTILNGGKLIGTRSGRSAEFTNTDSINDTAGFFNTNASFGSNYPITVMRATRGNDSSWQFLACDSSDGGDREFTLRGDGNAYADNSWNGGGADYAEYFEWLDGNSNNEDRRGYTVVLDGDKIRKANSGEVPIGVISTNPAFVGDSAWNNWNQKYLKDDFGSYIFEYHNVVEWETTEIDNNGNPKTISHSYEDWNLPEDLEIPENAVYKSHDDAGNAFKHKILNPDYNPDLEYITREDRPEWDMVGLLGKLRIRKGQPVDSRWIKMKDISENVEQWLVR